MRKGMKVMMDLLKRLLDLGKKKTSEKTNSENAQVVCNGDNAEWHLHYILFIPFDQVTILSKDGLIGSAYYDQIPDAIENLR